MSARSPKTLPRAAVPVWCRKAVSRVRRSGSPLLADPHPELRPPDTTPGFPSPPLGLKATLVAGRVTGLVLSGGSGIGCVGVATA